ncbi:multidrug ABC transporter ATP-binding protein, partial [Shigella sonnei]|nr:multidrug ABC transporter ATP-binding protein [Shigella sonnei]
LEASLYLVMRWFIDLLGSADRATILGDHAGEIAAAAFLVLVARPVSIWLHEALSNQLVVPQSTSQIRWRTHLYTLGHSLSYFQA